MIWTCNYSANVIHYLSTTKMANSKTNSYEKENQVKQAF